MGTSEGCEHGIGCHLALSNTRGFDESMKDRVELTCGRIEKMENKGKKTFSMSSTAGTSSKE